MKPLRVIVFSRAWSSSFSCFAKYSLISVVLALPSMSTFLRIKNVGAFR